ncbi:MAG: DUF3696 domain-containing protein [Caldilineaceae bacterium]
MITQLRIQNFKSWRDTGQMRFAPLTGFFGANSSGKTSILQMLLLMKQSAEARDRSQILFLGDEHSYVNLGGFTDIVHNHDEDYSIKLHLQWIPQRPSILQQSHLEPFLPQASDAVSFSASIGFIEHVITLKEMDYSQGDQIVGIEFDSTSEINHPTYKIVDHDDILASRDRLSSPVLPTPSQFFNFPDNLGTHFHHEFIAYEFVSLFRDFLYDVQYLGPLRDFPSRAYLYRGSRISHIGSRGQDTIPALISSQIVERDDAVTQDIAAKLKQLGLIHRFKIYPIAEGRREYEARIQQTPSAPEVVLTEVGFGVSQILPVLAICYLAKPGSTIILEQPEIHLHPAVQAGLADMFIDVIKNRGVQIILESHSEHLLRRLQRRMAEEQLAQDDVALYFTRMADGESKLDELDIDAYGNIRNWPENFFGDEMGDLVAMTEAAMQRQMRNGAAVGHTQEQ